MRLGACRWLGAQIRRAPGRPVTASAFTGASAAGSDAIRSAGLWELLEANGHYFNAHRMAALLAEVLEEPRGKARGDPRLQAYLQKAITSCHLYENLRELTAKDIAAAITSCREIGHPAAEDLSDVLVDTISEQLPRLSLVRVSFFITNFAKQQIEDTRFWKSAARAVADSSQPLTPQVVVSLLDAFRKSGLRSERLFQALGRRLYEVLDNLEPGHIPPIVATLCRVPMKEEDKEEVVRALLTRWLLMLRNEKEKFTGAITIQQILSLTVSLGLTPDLVNTAVFTKDVSLYIGNRFHLLRADEIIVFLWAFQRLVIPRSSTAFLSRGLHQVHHLWKLLTASSELSLQRLIQLSDVLNSVRHEGKSSPPFWTPELEELQELAIEDLVESVQYCQSDSLAQILEIWAGSEAFWQEHKEFGEAIAKRMEELLLEGDVKEIIPTMQAALAAPGLVKSLPERALQVLSAALLSRSSDEFERVRAVLSGSFWEVLCPPGAGRSSSSSDTAGSRPRESQGPSEFRALLDSWRYPRTEMDLAQFLRKATALCGDAEEALQALEAAAPFAEKLAASATAEVLQHLELLCQKILAEDLPASRLVSALQACAEAGLPYAPLCSAALSFGESTTASQALGLLESCSKLRLAVPELRLWLIMLLQKGLDRQLSANGLARLLAAAGRLSLLEAEEAAGVLHRLVTVASPIRPMQPDTMAALCVGLTLARWMPSTGHPDFWQVSSWLSSVVNQPLRPAQTSALRNFVLGLMIRPEGRAAVEGLRPDLQRGIAQAAQGLAHRRPVSDTTLKFRHEAAEVLRRAGQLYDLDISLGVGFVDLAVPGQDGALWLLDGPEAFCRPFQSDGAKTKLELVSAEKFRSELFLAVLQPGAAREMVAQLQGGSNECVVWRRQGCKGRPA
ncbi:unnamed protein product [Effrenium voratum]|nr:unnamed protein product [Effrenium voratum]